MNPLFVLLIVVCVAVIGFGVNRMRESGNKYAQRFAKVYSVLVLCTVMAGFMFSIPASELRDPSVLWSFQMLGIIFAVLDVAMVAMVLKGIGFPK